MDTPVRQRTSFNRTVLSDISPISRNTSSANSSILASPSNQRDESQRVSLTIDELKAIVKESVEEATKTKRIFKKDIRVDDIVKNGIHDSVNHLAKTDKSWDFSVGFKEGRNPNHTQEVLTALGNKIGSFDAAMAYKGCRTYFHTLKTREKKKMGNTMDDSLKQQRKRQRKSAARVRRKAALNTLKAVSDEDRENLATILENNDYISSEESEQVTDSESDEEQTRRTVFVKRKLPWRSEYVSTWFKTLDRRTRRKRNQQKLGGASMKKRIVTDKDSTREEPEDAPEFAVQQFEEAE